MLSPNSTGEPPAATEIKRRWPRHDCRFGISCAHYNNARGRYRGEMINYGVDGMYFVSDHVFQNGAIIFFRICDWCADDQAGAIQPGFRSLAFAQVRWRETIESGHGKRFGYGVKFLAHR